MPENISYNTVINLLTITILIYNYGKTFLTKNNNQTIEDFVNKIMEKNIINTLKLCDISKIALLDLSKNAPSGKVHTFIDDKVSDIQVGITINDIDKRICVVFRGSESIKDWCHNMNMCKFNIKDNIRVHKGFYNQLCNNGVYDKLLFEVKELLIKNHEYSLYLTGHSLGGALATLCGFMFSQELKNKITVISFASPRVGNLEWMKAFEKQENLIHYRITNDRDIITVVPVYKYYHVGIMIRLFENSYKIVRDYNKMPWYNYTIFNFWRISDHNSTLYYKRLVKNKW